MQVTFGRPPTNETNILGWGRAVSIATLSEGTFFDEKKLRKWSKFVMNKQNDQKCGHLQSHHLEELQLSIDLASKTVFFTLQKILYDMVY